MAGRAFDAVAFFLTFDALQIFQDDALALRREQIGETVPHELRSVKAEQRLCAAIAGVDVALRVEHHDALGGGVENGSEILGARLACGGHKLLG